MRSRAALLIVGLSFALSTPLLAQTPDWVNQILIAARLPVVAAEARQEGVPSDEIRAVLDAMTKAGVPAHEATAVIDTARVVRRDHGPVDNFGAFVQSQLAAGKRGRDLAAAIRAEHARAGMGRGEAAGRGRGQERGKADTGRGRGRGGKQPPGPPGATDQEQDNPARESSTAISPKR